MLILPALANVNVRPTGFCPPVSAPDRLTSTMRGVGPVRFALPFAGMLTAPPVIFTDDDASELTDTSWSPPVDEIDTKTPAWPPAASCWPSGGPRTNALLIVTSPTVAPAPAAAGWKASVGASR